MAKADANGMNNAAGIAYGELIRRQRKAKKMNQEELGALVRVGKNAVGAWEAGRSRPDVGSVPVICEALDLSLEEFFGMPDSSQERIDEKNGITPVHISGDEFLAYGIVNEPEEAGNMISQVNEELKRINEEDPWICDISASIGIYAAVPRKEDNIDIFMTMADRSMYADKNRRKYGRRKDDIVTDTAQ